QGAQCRLLAQSVSSRHRINSVAIGGEADITCPPASYWAQSSPSIEFYGVLRSQHDTNGDMENPPHLQRSSLVLKNSKLMALKNSEPDDGATPCAYELNPR